MDNNSNKIVKKNSNNYCAIADCPKRISLVDAIIANCKCGHTFCLLHRLAEKHDCKYNFKNEIDVKAYIEKNKCVAVKI